MARCKVCHRTMTNPAHIAVGMGPVCAAKAARSAYGNGNGAQAEAAYPVERYERIRKAQATVAAWLDIAERVYRLVLADPYSSEDERAEAKRVVRLRLHWLTRIDGMERRAFARLAPAAKVFAAA